MERRTDGITAVVPAIAIEVIKKAMEEAHSALLWRLTCSIAGGHLCLDKAGADDAGRDVGMIPGQDHGVARKQSLAQAISAVGVRRRTNARLGMLGNKVHGHIRRAQGALGLHVGNALHVRGSRTGSRHDDPAHLGTEQGQKGIRHPLGPPQVGVDDLLGGGTGVQTDAGVVDQPVQLLGLELLLDGFGGCLDGGLVGHVYQNRFDAVLARGLGDVGNRILALGFRSGSEEDVAATLDELLAQGLADSGIAAGNEDVFAHGSG